VSFKTFVTLMTAFFPPCRGCGYYQKHCRCEVFQCPVDEVVIGEAFWDPTPSHWMAL